MGLRRDEGWVIGADEDAMLRHAGQKLSDRFHDLDVDLLDRLHLFHRIALMARLVRSLDMHADEIGRGQFCDRRPALRGVVGIEIAGSTGHLQPLPAGERRQPTEQIDRRDHRAIRAIFLSERLHRRGAAHAPQPDVRGGPLAGRDPGLIDRMTGQPRCALRHDLSEQPAAGAAGEGIGD